MTTKHRLITDSFKMIKKARIEHEKQPPTPPQNGRKQPPTPPQNEAESSTMAEREKKLQQLKQFDLDLKYGPCTGITRLQRWERAQLHGLNPPQEIRELLMHTNNDPQFTLR